MNSPSLHWRRKLHALLHDTPDKAVNIASHELRSRMLSALDDLTKDEHFDREADWRASASDRIPFPRPTTLSQKLTELGHFSHPLGGATLPKKWNFASDAEAMEVSQKSRPILLNTEDPRAAFICAWRFWRNWASDLDPRFSHLPADTRVPDHSIWHHMAVTSAFQGALTDKNLRPCLLLFSIGPVQDFIAAARSHVPTGLPAERH